MYLAGAKKKNDNRKIEWTDESDLAIGAVLQQRPERDGEPLAFYSTRLNAAQTKYSACDRELLVGGIRWDQILQKHARRQTIHSVH